MQRQFWRLIATGMSTAEASLAIGVSVPVGSRWFRHAGGMTPLSLDEPTGRYLSFAEREEIALLRAQDVGVREIARRVGRDPGTISRELRRNAATRSGKQVYRALVAQWKAQQASKRPKSAKLLVNNQLREYVQERLAGSVRLPDGTVVEGPQTPAWKGPEQAASTGPEVGDCVEPGADFAPVENRLPSMMSPCVSATRRSTSHCSSRAAAPSNVIW